jgi:hypothetical protein
MMTAVFRMHPDTACQMPATSQPDSGGLAIPCRFERDTDVKEARAARAPRYGGLPSTNNATLTSSRSAAA